MNEFYSISQEGHDPSDNFQLTNLGRETVIAIIGKSVRGDWGQRTNQSQTFYRDTKPEDYDGLFVSKLLDCDPPYELGKVIEYHFKFYIEKSNGDKDKFLKHIQYVVLPTIKKSRDSDVCVELVEHWLKSMTAKKKKKLPTNIRVGDINAPTQFLVNSDYSNQNQSIQFSPDDIKELLNKLRIDIENIEDEIRKEFKDEIEKTLQQLNKNKDVKGRLLTIGGMIKDVGIGVFTNLISSPAFELLKPMLGLA